MSRNDDLIIAHTRRELELAGAFNIDDGILGKAVLSVMKTLQHYAKDNQELREALGGAVDILCRGGLLSDPTDSPDEWVELKGKEGTWSNKRNPFFVSPDGGKTWHHLISKQEGVSKEVGNVQEKANGTTKAKGAKPAGAGKGWAGSASDDRAAAGLEKDAGVEKSPQHSGVQPETHQDTSGPEVAAPEPPAGETT